MMVSIHLGSIFNVKADVFTLPVDKYLRLTRGILERADVPFGVSYHLARDNAFWSNSLPLVRPTVMKVDKGNVLSCEGVMLVYDGVINKDAPSSTELRKVRQAYKCFFDYAEEFNYQSVAITLPSTNSRKVYSEILHAIFNRAPRVGVEKVMLLSESPAVLEIVRSLMGANRLLLDKIVELNATLKSLKVAPPSVFLSAFKKIQKMTTKKQKCSECQSEFISLGNLVKHFNRSHSDHPKEPEVVDKYQFDLTDNFSHKLENMARLRDAYNRLSLTSNAFDTACKKIKSPEKIESFCRDTEKLITRHLVTSKCE